MTRYKDRTGQVIRGLKFIRLTDKRRGNKIMWEIECTCGKIFLSEFSPIKLGRTTSCGCLRQGLNMRRNYRDLTGQVVNNLTFIRDTNKRISGVIWEILCHCGTIFEARGQHVLSGNIRSCGCFQRQEAAKNMLKHLLPSGPEHPCYNPNITDEERELNREKRTVSSPKSVYWRKQVFQRDGYTCKKCNHRGELRAHHLNGWHWCKEERFDINNGVTLCKYCHKNFHHQYGSKNNTIEQYISWFLHS